MIVLIKSSIIQIFFIKKAIWLLCCLAQKELTLQWAGLVGWGEGGGGRTCCCLSSISIIEAVEAGTVQPRENQWGTFCDHRYSHYRLKAVTRKSNTAAFPSLSFPCCFSLYVKALEFPEQDRTLEGDGACDHEGSFQGDAESDPFTITPPVSEPCSPLPPVDGFFRRLGSLFPFTRTQPGEEDTQHSVKKVAETSAEKEEHSQPLKPQEVFDCTAGPEGEVTIQTEQYVQDTQ